MNNVKQITPQHTLNNNTINLTKICTNPQVFHVATDSKNMQIAYLMYISCSTYSHFFYSEQTPAIIEREIDASEIIGLFQHQGSTVQDVSSMALLGNYCSILVPSSEAQH